MSETAQPHAVITAPGPRARTLALVLASALGTTPAAAADGSATSTGLALGAAALIGALLALGAVALWQRLRDARELAALRRTLTAAADWTWRTDADGRVLEAQRGRQRLPWLDPVALVGRPLAAGLGVADEAVQPLQQALDARAPFFDLVLPAAGDAGTRSIGLSGAPLLGADGRFAGFAGVGRDLTALARALAPAQDSAQVEQLRAEYAQRTHQLELAGRELDSFAHSVSHDLRAPLRVVDGFANIVLEDYAQTGRPLDDLGREHIRRIIAAAGRMNAMIDTLLSMSKMTSRELTRERVDLSQVARELTEDLRAQDRTRAVEFVVAEGLSTDGDATLLRLVLQNLLGNAYKFSARAPQARVEFGVRRDGADTVYYVRDNGAGFDMRFAEKLFGLFQRLHSANEFPGTGVGLATVQRIVRKHGGRIWAESAPGQGATFYFTLWERVPAR